MATAAAPAKPEFTFEEATHVYRLAGVEIPGVTTILREAQLVDLTWFTEYGRKRGSAIHLCTQLHDEADLDEASVAPEILPYLEAYRQFRAETGFIPGEIERPRFHAALRYAGTPDRIGTLPGGTDKLRHVVLDLKRGQNLPVYRIQTAGYANLMDDPLQYERVTLFLEETGKYRMKVHPKAEFASDLAVFRSALNVVNFKRREGI